MRRGIVGEAHEAGGQSSRLCRDHPLDQAIGARFADQGSEGIAGYSQAVEAGRGGNDAAGGIDDRRILAGLVEPGNGTRGYLGSAAP
jgi:hypothetical protein